MIGLGFAASAIGGETLAKIKRIVLLTGLVGAASFITGQCEGKRAERAHWEAEVARIALKAAQLQRTADQILARARVIDAARIATNRQEIDNAVRNIPDQGLTDRQRAVFCVRLRRENPAAFQSHPACRPSQPSGSPTPAR